MNTKIITSLALGALVGSAFAEETAELEQQSPSGGRWTVSAGYAWRASAETSFRGQQSQAPGGIYQNGSYFGAQDWTFDGTFDEGLYTEPNYGLPVYSMGLMRGEAVGGGADEDCAHGLNLAVGYDVWTNERLAVAVRGRFAGYWGMETGRWGGYREYYDNYSFGFPTPDLGIGTPVEGVDSADVYEGRTYGRGGENPSTHLRSDLYQIGLGPQVTWSPFVGRCDCMDWLDIYANVEALCNIIRSEFDAGAASTTETNCKIGFGGNVGLVGNITDWCGIYGQIGYEWIDKDDVSTHGMSAETDYSSMVLSVGAQFRF